MLRKNEEHIVIGCGALGLFLARQLSVNIDNKKLFLFSRSSYDKETYINISGKNEVFNHKISTNFFDLLDKIKSLQISLFYIYICLPPEEVDSLLILIKQSLPAHSQFVIILLNNGIVSPSIVKLLIEQENINIFRGIVLAGFLRHKLETRNEIRHTSGNKIYYNSYSSFKNSKDDYKFKTLTPFFNWEQYDNILLLELAKFFVNLTLFLYLTPNILKNEDLWTIATREQIQHCSQHFASLTKHLVSEDKVSQEHLGVFCLNLLEETTKLTSKNTNSLTLAWSKGIKNSPLYFLQTLNKWIQESKNPESGYFFSKLINALKENNHG